MPVSLFLAHLFAPQHVSSNTPHQHPALSVGPGEPSGCTASCATKTGQGDNRWGCLETANFPALPSFASVSIKALLSSGEALLSSLPCSLLIFLSAALGWLTPATVSASSFHVCGRALEKKESKRGEKNNNATNNCLGILEKRGRGLCLENSLSFVFSAG